MNLSPSDEKDRDTIRKIMDLLNKIRKRNLFFREKIKETKEQTRSAQTPKEIVEIVRRFISQTTTDISLNLESFAKILELGNTLEDYERWTSFLSNNLGSICSTLEETNDALRSIELLVRFVSAVSWFLS